MSQTVRAYAAQSATSPLAPFTFQYRDPRADDVVIDILYTGVCHSDLTHRPQRLGRHDLSRRPRP